MMVAGFFYMGDCMGASGNVDIDELIQQS